MQLGDFQDKAWEYNTNIPFQRKMNEYWATKQAGQANLWGGIDQMAGGVVNFNSSMDKTMNQIMGAFTGGMAGGGGNNTTATTSTGLGNQQIPIPAQQPLPYQNVGGSPSQFFGGFTIPRG
jgi:hypothetical protein